MTKVLFVFLNIKIWVKFYPYKYNKNIIKARHYLYYIVRICNMIHAVLYQRFLTSLCLLFMKTVTYFPFDTKLLLVSSTYIRIYKWSDKSKRCCFRGVYVVHSPWYQNWLHCIIQYFVTSLTKTIFFRYTMFQFQYKKMA